MDTSFDLKNIYIVSNFGICEFSKGSIWFNKLRLRVSSLVMLNERGREKWESIWARILKR
jgi:hypothetical protein